MKGNQLNYRPDIDGLRAVAVLLVLLFHFSLGVPGGFVGVDVFFVISGFLITDVIRNSCHAGRFSFYDFYARRLTRLHPALLVTVGLSLIAGYLIMDPASLVSLAKASAYTIFSVSNILFWNTQDYFDASAAMQPLLHTWSLSVEWQFYAVWPLIVWASLKVSDRLLLLLLAVIGVASLAGSQLMLGVDSSASYFLMPFRVFELATGAILVFTKGLQCSSRSGSIGTILGLVLIVVSAFALESKSAFPGVAALAPCLGAALCIQFGASPAGYLLRFKPMVRIGLISYSVYLVHWPLLVFAKYYLYRDLSIVEGVALLVASIALGQAIYSLVERKFINRSRAGRPIPLLATGSGMAVVMALSISLVSSQGAPNRVPDKYQKFVENPSEFHMKNFGGAGYDYDTKLGTDGKDSQFLLAGDSFAMQYASGVDQVLKGASTAANGQFTLGCFLSRTHTRFENGASKMECQDRYKSIMSFLHKGNYPLILSMNWSGYLPYISDFNGHNLTFDSVKQYEEFIYKSLDEMLTDAGQRKVFIVGVAQFLEAPASAASCLLRPDYIHQSCEDRLTYSPDQAFAYSINRALQKYAEARPDTYFIDPADSLCKGGSCSISENGEILFSDPNHLSKYGSLIVSKDIVRTVEEHIN
ncbi:TPA: acyltransferase [Pseudomonas putida]|uniref:acyltransferase family protein n=1 Tax=Pseudomonas putida TaxID=303 RepID=UPI002364557F|nr:acyltransferase family protein [Pseudomonas putida]MDD2153346.1 acyltransferase [Pseudomonas putida]HDS1681255.1 acyltransferase [Pseudomonas putida]